MLKLCISIFPSVKKPKIAHDIATRWSSLEKISRSINSWSIDLPSGSIESNNGEILIRAKNQGYSIDDFNAIPVITDEVGSVVRLGDISNINDDNVVVLIGKRGTGKSFLVKDLLYYHTDLPIGTVVSGTESANRFYGNFVPNAFIHDEVSSDLIKNITTRQKLVMQKK